jgi:triacylglycerol esterase/lipase EstA (alpha/beta hydrolase family)
MRAPAIRRPTVGILIAALILTLAAQHATATAVGARTDDTTKVTIFIHGYSGGDCEGDWGFLMDHMRQNGWTGSFYVPKFLTGDSNCNPRPGMAMGCMNCTGSHTFWFGHSGTTHSNNTSIRHLAWHLANYIATNFTARGVAVDVVAHSMGGLMIRYALAKQGVDSFPRLMVEDVVTLGSPHKGASFAALTGTTQGAEMEPGSSLITWLKTWGMNPKGTGGTDWTVIGSHGDLIVQEDSATAMSAPHRWRYTTSPNWIFHRDYMKSSADGSKRRAQYPCISAPGWCETSTFYPVQMIRAATQYGSQ